jgi:glyoxylase-like metal-dependent hydrolase (beta-lactamase superfamily II)
MIQLTSVESNRQWLDGGSMFGNAPRAVWQKWTEVDDKGRIPLACRCLLIEWNNLKILCEAGIGAFFEPKLAERFGVQNSEKNQLVENLKQVGVNPSEIDYVILSHLHFDHAGGLLPAFSEMQKGSSDLVFSKAQFIVGEKAWKRALHPHMRDRASFIPMLNKKLEESGRLQIISDNKAPEPLNEIIDFFESNGHTPGQMHTLVKGQQQSVIFAGDLIPGSPWVHLPITMGYDRYPEKLIEEKQTLYKDFSDKNLQIFFTHDSQWSLGKLEKNEKGHYQVAQTRERLNQFTI